LLLPVVATERFDIPLKKEEKRSEVKKLNEMPRRQESGDGIGRMPTWGSLPRRCEALFI
jgi:hypothetical protein